VVGSTCEDEEAQVPESIKLSPRDYARYQGKLYFANGRPPGLMALKDVETGQVLATVPIADLDEWYQTTVKGTFLGHDFLVVSEHPDSTYHLDYIGSDGIWADRVWSEDKDKYPGVSFSRSDQFTFSATVPKDMVTDIHEERRDSLTPWRERQEGERSS
jgi:hypothetical protein